MTLCLPAYGGVPDRKARFLARLDATDWTLHASFGDAFSGDPLATRGAFVPVHDATGFPATLLALADSVFANLPTDRRARFAHALFEAPDVGVDLVPVPTVFLRRLVGFGGTPPMPLDPTVAESRTVLGTWARGRATVDWDGVADCLLDTLRDATPA